MTGRASAYHRILRPRRPGEGLPGGCFSGSDHGEASQVQGRYQLQLRSDCRNAGRENVRPCQVGTQTQVQRQGRR